MSPRAIVAVLPALVVVFAQGAHATPARTAALAGSPLFPDSEDVFRFPSTTPRYAGLFVVSEAGPAAPGTAGVLLGDRLAGGFFVGGDRGAADLALRAQVYPEAGVVVPARLVDALVAVRIDEVHTAGLLIGISHTLDRATNATFGDNGTVASSVSVVASHSYDLSDGTQADTSVGLDLSYFRRTERFEVTHEAPVDLSVTLSHRSLWPLGGPWSVGVAATTRSDDLRLELPAAGRSSDGTAWTLSLEAGPRFAASPSVTVAASLVLGRQAWEVDALQSPPRSEDQGGVSTDLLPGFRAAIEARVFSFMTARMGLFGGRTSVSTRDGNGNTAAASAATFQALTGLGFHAGGLSVDGVVVAEFLRSGPQLLGGAAPGLFSLVSVSYAF